MTPTPVGMRCPECASQRTRVHRAPAAAQSAGVPLVTRALIAINVVVFLAEIAGGTHLFGPAQGSVFQHGALFGPYVQDGDYWRLISCGFLHNGLVHIGMNMWILWMLGRMIEPALGGARYVLVYFTALLCGSFGALLSAPDAASIGASGAIFGLMGAAVPMMRSRGINLGQTGLLPLIVLNLVLTFTISGISIGAHVGGLIGGFIAGWMLDRAPRRGPASWAPVGGCVALSAIAIAAGIGVA